MVFTRVEDRRDTFRGQVSSFHSRLTNQRVPSHGTTATNSRVLPSYSGNYSGIVLQQKNNAILYSGLDLDIYRDRRRREYRR